MFYSVDILTRKGRLGLIWLAATYGDSKKGMANRDFRKVNISRACHDIMNPILPFALRLSSNLLIGVVRIYREQTKTVWVEVAHMWKTIKNASEMRASEIDLLNPALREEAITDTLEFTTESFRLDLEVHSVAVIGLDAYFAVNGNGHHPPVISPPRPVVQFSPPSIPGTPVHQGTPQWKTPSDSEHEHSPYQAQPHDIRIPEVNHVWMLPQDPIKIPGEVDITEDPTLPEDLPLDHTDGGRDVRLSRPTQSRPRSQSPCRRPRSPRHRSRSPRHRSKSPRHRSRSPRHRSRSPRHRSRSPRGRSRSPRLPQRHSPRPDVQPTESQGSPPPSTVDPLDAYQEPSLADVLLVDRTTAQLVLPGAPDDSEIQPTVPEKYQGAVPFGLVTPGVPITTATPSPPKKRRRMAIDRNIQIDADVIRRNVDTEGRETLCERSLDEHPLKSAKDLFWAPATEALLSSPFLHLWKRNAVTTPREYSSDSGGSGEGSPLITTLPVEGSIEVPRHSMGTPSEKEVVRDNAPAEGSGLLEHSSRLEFTPDPSEGSVNNLSTTSDQVIQLDMEEPAPPGRSSSILRPPMIGLLSPIQEPADFDEFGLDDIELPPLMEQPEVQQPLEEQAYETMRLVTKAMRDSDSPVVFIKLCPPQSTVRKSAAKVFYHLLALHKNGVFELKQRDPFNLTNIYIHKGKNF